uniref:Phospholipid/glycerol acyltransferase domain-containing protein n=1 Tax=Salvator merianae TaxID=96440 RepID=A0A8D0BZF1_SALMN
LKMTADSTLELENTPWLTYILENYSMYTIGPLTLMIILSILYYPAIVFFFISYSSSAFYFIYKKIANLPEDTNSEQWDKPKQVVTFVHDTIGKFLHGYEVCGLENLPEGPAVLIFYHGVPVDYYLLVLRIYRLTGRFCYSTVDHAVFTIPGLKIFLHAHRVDHPTREECVEILKEGNLLGIGPGGVREQNYGDNNYKLIWRKRKGFADVAIKAKVPIIPVFTQNIREAYRIYGNTRIMRWLYEKTRIVFFPGYGLLPVKLRTHIGQPIPYDPNITIEELVEKTKAAVESLRDRHQKIPGSIWRALKERFDWLHKYE